MVAKENDPLRWEVLWHVFMLLGMIIEKETLMMEKRNRNDKNKILD